MSYYVLFLKQMITEMQKKSDAKVKHKIIKYNRKLLCNKIHF